MNDDTLHWVEESLGAEAMQDLGATQHSIHPVLSEVGSPALPQPTTLPDFEIMRVLGEGGMGQVLLAKQRSLGREVAIKVLKPSRINAATQHALLHEARMTGALEHPNIIPLHLLSHDSEGMPLLVMKRVEGVSWKELLHDPAHSFWAKEPGERIKQNLEILIQVCNAMHFAHTQGFIHRDIKPANIMLGNFGEVYVLDWGVALALDADGTCTAPSLAGTLSYIAPEMLVRGEKLSPRSDIYLLGATLYEVLTGLPPHQGSSLAEVIKASLQPKPRTYPEGLSTHLIAICEWAMSPLPKDRLESALQLRQQLTMFLQRRTSVELSEAANEKLSKLRALLQKPAPPALEIYNLSGEARFGFEQALRSWQENPLPQEGLSQLAAMMAEFELTQRNPGAVRMHLAVLATAPAELVRRLETLEQDLEKERAAVEKLKALEYQQDTQISAAQRVLVMLFGNVSYVGGMMLFARLSSFELWQAPALHLLWLQVFYSACIFVLALFTKGFFFRNEINKKLYYATLLLTTALLTAHLFGVVTYATAPQIFLWDIFLWCLFSALLGVFLSKVFLWNAAADWALLFVGAFVPKASAWLLGLSFLLMTVSVTALWQRKAKAGS